MSASTTTDPKFFTVPDLLSRWGISRTTLHREVKRKKIKPTYIAGAVRFAAQEVARYEKASAK